MEEVARIGIGAEIVGMDGLVWGRVVAEERKCWRLADGRVARASKATHGKKWMWAVVADEALNVSCVRPEQEASNEKGIVWPENVITAVCDWLPLPAALCTKGTAKDWATALTGHLPLVLPPPQTDAFLCFCLLEVLVNFDEDRLPLPVSAVYSEMRSAARRAITNEAYRARLEELILRKLGPACKSQQEKFLQQRRPHHICWDAQLKNSGFKSLQGFARHFASRRLIGIINQRWQKRIHHSPNLMTCQEWLLTKVNRQHPLFVDHEAWRLRTSAS